MQSVRDIVEKFLEAYYRGDAAAAKQHLADDLVVVGPAIRFDGPDKFLKSSAHVAAGFEGLEIQRVFEDGTEVCLFYEMRVKHTAPIPMAQWFQVRGERISSIRLIFDTGPFVRASKGTAKPEEQAIDPVCQMAVDKCSPPATWAHDGVTYYFCNPGCAEAFKKDPEAYLRPS